MIRFKYLMWFRGRNGTFKLSGLLLNKYQMNEAGKEFIVISAVNSQSKTGSCWMEIPMENIDELIERLKQLKDERKDN